MNVFHLHLLGYLYPSTSEVGVVDSFFLSSFVVAGCGLDLCSGDGKRKDKNGRKEEHQKGRAKQGYGREEERKEGGGRKDREEGGTREVSRDGTKEGKEKGGKRKEPRD
ncbi:hypothetical protein Tco_0840691 [Tanacetum coccineum]|uniref:Uncharacterized protein n=1 Tax=Tanacetum coccineum TaxID=301880 RepID=A0ABQ5AW57_9ASTR